MFTKREFSSLEQMSDIAILDSSDFEQFCKFLLEQSGYDQVTITRRIDENNLSRDVEIEMYEKDVKMYVQCKKSVFGSAKDDVLTAWHVRELGGCMLRDKINSGMIITDFEIEDLARKEAVEMNIKLLGSEEIKVYMEKINPNFDTKKTVKFSQIIKGMVLILFIMLVITVFIILLSAFVFSFFT